MIEEICSKCFLSRTSEIGLTCIKQLHYSVLRIVDDKVTASNLIINDIGQCPSSSPFFYPHLAQLKNSVWSWSFPWKIWILKSPFSQDHTVRMLSYFLYREHLCFPCTTQYPLPGFVKRYLILFGKVISICYDTYDEVNERKASLRHKNGMFRDLLRFIITHGLVSWPRCHYLREFRQKYDLSTNLFWK